SCNNVIGKYSLFNNYEDLFRIQNENNSEIILDVEYLQDDQALWGLGTLPPASAGGWYIVGPTQSLVDAYEMNNGKTIDDPSSGYDPNNPYKNRDPRLAATIIVPGSTYNGKFFDPVDATSVDYYVGYAYTGYSIRKYIHELSDYSDIWNTGLNIPVIRYAEVLLTYAEAKIESNQIDNSVYEAIDQVRIRAGLPAVDRTVYASQSQMRELVRRERRVELALEGLRWYDIQRWKIGDQVMTGPALGCREGTVDPITGHYTPTGPNIVVEQRTFKNYLWPIPQSEIDVNKNLVQNPGY
ncbi:MAG TPA: RagB/SusD family nutrient uptake outer membrane protein, partial [Flavitalea sp.]|nr:RagB/SusD family nutrient uptake outer membrane protein [Flavitalea sp.]